MTNPHNLMGGESVKRLGIGLVAVMVVVMLALSGAASAETLRVLLPIGGGYTEEDQLAIAEDYMASHPDVEIEMEFVGWDALWDRIVTSIATGNAPDVIYIASRWIPALADMGAIIPLDEYIDEEKWELYYPSVWESVEYQGQHWGIVRAMSTKGLLYNKTLLEEAGVELPLETWDDVLEAARKVHNPPEVYGFGLPANRFVSTVTEFQNWLYANGARITDENGVATLDSPEAVEAMEFYFGDLKEYAQPSPIEWRREDLIRLFKSGTIAIYTDHVFSVIEAQEAGIDVGAQMVPGGPHGDMPYATVVVTDSIAIPAQTQNKDLAIEFAMFMTNFENQAKWDTTMGFIPPMPAEADLELFSPWYWQIFINGLEYGIPQAVYIQDWEGVQEAILTATQKYFLGQTDAETALKEAAQTVNILQGVQ